MVIQKINTRSGSAVDKYDHVHEKNLKLVCKSDVAEFRDMVTEASIGAKFSEIFWYCLED